MHGDWFFKKLGFFGFRALETLSYEDERDSQGYIYIYIMHGKESLGRDEGSFLENFLWLTSLWRVSRR